MFTSGYQRTFSKQNCIPAFRTKAEIAGVTIVVRK